MSKLIYILSFLIILLFFSCGQSSAEKTLNGKWYESENENFIWHFYPDSLVITEDPFIKVQWKATDSKIEIDYPTFYWDSLGKPIDIVDNIVIDYQLSNNRDTLFGTLKNPYGDHKFGLIRNENL